MAKFDMNFEQFNNIIKELDIKTFQVENALRKAGNVFKKAVQNNTPVSSGKLKKGVQLKIKKNAGNIVMSVQFNDKTFWDLFQEFGTSKQRKNIGFFSRAVNAVENEAFNVLKENIYKK